MNREYTIRVEGDDSWAVYQNNNTTIEIPISVHGANIQDELDQTLMANARLKIKTTKIRDDVYVNQELVRQDYSISTMEGAEILEELSVAFSGYADFNHSDLNIVGKYEGYREPYQNPSISWYSINREPSESLQLSFNTSYPNSNLKGWFGLKFDMVTKEVLFKPVIVEYKGDVPELPIGETFYAITHQQDGASSEWIDAYVYATPKRIREFCTDKGLEYPLSETTHLDCDVVWCWGFVFHKDTLEYGAVKAYARYNKE